MLTKNVTLVYQMKMCYVKPVWNRNPILSRHQGEGPKDVCLIQVSLYTKEQVAFKAIMINCIPYSSSVVVIWYSYFNMKIISIGKCQGNIFYQERFKNNQLIVQFQEISLPTNRSSLKIRSREQQGSKQKAFIRKTMKHTCVSSMQLWGEDQTKKSCSFIYQKKWLQ